MDAFDPHSSATTGYHLFFLPPPALRQELKGIIRTLSFEYAGPVFEPHVTLLARIPDAEGTELVQKTKALAMNLQPLSLTIGGLRSEDAYFRALYAEIVEQEALLALHEQASEIFDMQPSPAYRGHLSLLYGNYPEERKQQSIQQLTLPEGASFVADTIHLFKTPGRVDTWHEIVRVPLRN